MGSLKHFLTLNKSFLCQGIEICKAQVRFSKYSARFLEPTFRRENLSEPLDVSDPRNYQPIKAAKNEQTSFATYDFLVNKLVNTLLRMGNKDLARFIVFKTFENIKLKQIEYYNNTESEFEKELIETDPTKLFHKAVENCKPLLNIEKIKRGGVQYQVPVPMMPHTQTRYSLKWLIESANEKDDNERVWDRLADEIIDASNNEGKSIRKKEELHRLCEANRAYAHFRW